MVDLHVEKGKKNLDLQWKTITCGNRSTSLVELDDIGQVLHAVEWLDINTNWGDMIFGLSPTSSLCGRVGGGVVGGSAIEQGDDRGGSGGSIE
jgi:hypothetical protein